MTSGMKCGLLVLACIGLSIACLLYGTANLPSSYDVLPTVEPTVTGYQGEEYPSKMSYSIASATNAFGIRGEVELNGTLTTTCGAFIPCMPTEKGKWSCDSDYRIVVREPTEWAVGYIIDESNGTLVVTGNGTKFLVMKPLCQRLETND